jgi:hypothetical protein
MEKMIFSIVFFWGGINPSFLKNNGVQYFDNLADVIYDDSQ